MCPAPGKAVRHPRSPALAATKTEATLLVCWEASGSTLMPVESHVGLFFQLAVAADLNHGPAPAPGQNAFKMGFGGISTTQGIRGLCCAVGLADQVASVVERVRTLLQHHWHLAVTVVGASRGAVAGLMLARALEEADLGEGRIALHLCLIDPVPGNLIWVSRLLSPCKMTVTAACLDVSGCTCLRSVLALYPCEPLADCACHAPVLPSYPASCDVEEDATLGLHTDVVATAAGDSWTRHDRLLAYTRVRRFLVARGVELRNAYNPAFGGGGGDDDDGGLSTLDGLPPRVRERVVAFVAAAEPESVMRVGGGVLDATQRHAVHQYAAMYNVDSVSVGPPNERGLVLSVPEYAAARVDPPQDSPAALEARCLEAMEAAVKARMAPSSRTAHHFDDRGSIERRRDGDVLNHFHRTLLAEADPSAVVVDIEPLEGRASTTSPKVAPEGGGRMLLRVRRDVKFRHTRIILIILVVVCLAAFGISTAV